MRLSQLTEILKGKIFGNSEVLFEGLSLDSRTTGEGDLFFALPGSQLQGSHFAREALGKGASALVCQKDQEVPQDCPRLVVEDVREALGQIASHFYGNPTSYLNVVGITGTNGKTTTSYLLKGILDKAFQPAALLGTIEYRLGDQVFSASNTTPSSLQIHQMASKAHRGGMRSLVMEVSSHGLAQKRVAGVNFDSAIFTNLTGDHLDYHKTMKEYLKSKTKLFELLSPEGSALLNGDDPAHREIQKRVSGQVFLYGIQNKKAHFRVENLEMTLEGSSFVLKGPTFAIPIFTPLVGYHNVLNCLAASSSAFSLGIHPGFIKEGIESVQGVAGRMESIPNPFGIKVLVDYAHTDDALKNALTLISSLKKRKIITVFGCGGNRDKTKRPRMGKVAAENSDWVIVTSDNPRKEEPSEILKDIEKGIPTSNYEMVLNRKEAIYQALSMARKGDIVLIAGKGHEDYQEGQSGKIWFDDRVVARQALERRMGRKAG